jgi:hypothetical protein
VKLLIKIVIWWLSILGVYFFFINIFPTYQTPLSAHLNQFIQSLLFVITFYIYRNEKSKLNKFIFLNFTIFFSLSIFSLGYDFLPKDFIIEKYSRHIISQYLIIAYSLCISTAIIYLVIDNMFRDLKIYKKYIVAFGIVSLFFIYFLLPFIKDPLYLYSTEDIKQWKEIDAYVSKFDEVPSPIEIANNITLQSWKNGKVVGDLYPEENLKRIKILSLYLGKDNDNWRVLLWKPIYLRVIYFDVLIIGFILLFFGYQYKKDPPQSAYIDKIMFLFLILQSMDVLHNWGFIKSVEWGSMTELFIVGQYITILSELSMVLFFGLRLRFITSVQGEFYETELLTNPQSISRWRDLIDNYVLSHFFNYKIFNGRLFQNPSSK